jgi:hypothetical protein
VAEGNGAGEKGFNGKLLNVNLSTGEIAVERPDESLYRQYLGGYGIGRACSGTGCPPEPTRSVPTTCWGCSPGC